MPLKKPLAEPGSCGCHGARVAGGRTYRKSLYAQGIHRCREFIESSGHPFQLTQTHLLLAMTHRKWNNAQALGAGGRAEAARGLGRTFGPRFSGRESNLMNYGWTEWLDARMLCDEARRADPYDPNFPADPFAG